MLQMQKFVSRVGIYNMRLISKSPSGFNRAKFGTTISKFIVPKIISEQRSNCCSIIEKIYMGNLPDEKSEHIKFYCDNKNTIILRHNNNVIVLNKKNKHMRIYRDANGNDEFCLTFVNEILHGAFRSWYPDGVLKEVGACKDGILNGEYKKYNERGLLVKLYTFENGIIGEFKEWNDDGSLHTSGLMTDYNSGMIEEWNNGKRIKQTNIRNGKRNGLFRLWHDNGTLKREYSYANNKFDKLYRSWHPNGVLKFECRYENAKLNGEYKKWDSTGKLILYRKYLNGKQFEKSVHWDPILNDYVVCSVLD